MNYKHIVLLPDLFRGQRATSEGFFAFIQEPINLGCGINPGWPPTSRNKSSLLDGFNLQDFRKLGGWDPMRATDFWTQTWLEAPQPAVDYLFSHLKPDSLILAYEIPPWLILSCNKKGIDWIDIRPSSLAFGRDIYLAIRSSNHKLQKRLLNFNIQKEELKLEAALLTANLHNHRLQMEEGYLYNFNLDGTLIFIGQPFNDASLISEKGKILCCSDFSADLIKISKNKKVLYLLDERNYSSSTLHINQETLNIKSQQECERLSNILNTSIQKCNQSLYQVLSAQDDLEIAGISAPALQEAQWFGKKAHTLYKPSIPFIDSTNEISEGYIQIHFKKLLSPYFWHKILTPNKESPRILNLPEIERNQARMNLNNWGNYEQVTTWERQLHHASFERSGGFALRKRIDNLEKLYKTKSIVHPSSKSTMEERIHELKDSKNGMVAYVLGNAPSLNQLDIPSLLKEESFWCNRAFDMEKNGIKFSPKYYFLSDRMGFQEFGEQAMSVRAETKFFSEKTALLARKNFPKNFIDQKIITYGGNPAPLMFEGEGHFSTDPSIIVNGSYTVILDAIQFAFYMGYEKVYVGGVDLDYSGDPYFYGGKTADFIPLNKTTEKMKSAFIVARKHFEKHGRILSKITKSPNLPLDYTPNIFNIK